MGGDPLNLAWTLCRQALADGGGVMASLAVAGLVGGFTHCAGMCGPFVVSQTLTRLEAMPAAAMGELRRLAGAALVPYHLGRGTTYAGLGAIAAAAAGGIEGVAGLRWPSAIMLATAATVFAGRALADLGIVARARTAFRPGPVVRALGRVTRPLLERPRGWRGYGLGVALGFLPCGLLYGAVAAAAAAGGALAGALAMVAFALATVPALVVVGLAGHLAGERGRTFTRRVAPLLLLINAGILSYLAWHVVA